MRPCNWFFASLMFVSVWAIGLEAGTLERSYWEKDLESEGERESLTRKEQFEKDQQYLALLSLDRFLLAGTEEDVWSGAELFHSFKASHRHAYNSVQRMFRKHASLLSGYVGISDELYGSKLEIGPQGLSYEVAGRVTCGNGVLVEFEATLVEQGNGWLVSRIDLD